MSEIEAGRALLEHGVLGALVVLQFGVILWLIKRLTEKVNGQARRLDIFEQKVVKSKNLDEK